MKLAEITNHSFEEMLENGLSHDDYLCHYGVKGMKWKNHIYSIRNKLSNKIRKAKGLYYRGKSKIAEQKAWNARLHTGVKKSYITDKTRILRGGNITRYTAYGIRPGSSGKANSHSGQTGSRLNAGLAAGRYRAAQKKSVKKYYNNDTGLPKDWGSSLRYRGHSSSMTNSGETGSRVNQGTAAGRERAKKKKKK